MIVMTAVRKSSVLGLQIVGNFAQSSGVKPGPVGTPLPLEELLEELLEEVEELPEELVLEEPPPEPVLPLGSWLTAAKAVLEKLRKRTRSIPRETTERRYFILVFISGKRAEINGKQVRCY